MKNPLILISVIILFMSFTVFPQKKIWFPDKLNIQPFTANVIEPKAGFEFLLAKSELRLNIGTSKDFLLIKNNNHFLSFGADLFTYSLLRSESNFHFPVDAIDYLFGLNAGFIVREKGIGNDCDEDNEMDNFKMVNERMEYGFRFRLSHISAHFVDGHFDFAEYNWRDGRKPQVYSREFFELFPFFNIQNFRVYLGFTYIFNVTPKNLGKEIYQAGFDYYLPNIINEKITPFASYDFKLNKICKFSGSNSFAAGVKFGNYSSKGFSIRFSYFSGKSIHGEYFDINESYSTIGFNIDL